MEKNKIFEKQVKNISEISPEKKQTVSPPLLPSYSNSYSETQMEWAEFEYTWKINEFARLHKKIDVLRSPSFPETAEYTIQMNVSRKTNSPSTLKFYLLTTKTFTGSCTTTILMHGHRVSSRSISGCISDMTLLFEGLSSTTFKHCGEDKLCTIHCKFEMFHKLISNTIHMNLQASSTVCSKDISLENSTLDKFDGTSVTFKAGGCITISKKLLHATNSRYFKDICFTYEGKVKDMTNVLTQSQLLVFEKMLIFIQTGSIRSNNYGMLKELLTMTDDYDVPTLKLTCEYYLLRKITVCNAVELIQLAFKHDAEFLKINSAAFIKFHIKEVMDKTLKNVLRESSNEVMELIDKTKLKISTDLFYTLPATHNT